VARSARRQDADLDALVLHAASVAVLYVNSKSWFLASAEGNDAPDRIVGGNANRYSIPRHHLDSKAAHTAAQLRKHLVALIALHAVKTATVNRHDRALHVN
jgi:hypothetical protein